MSKTNKINYSFKSKFIRQEIFNTAIKAKKGHIPPAFADAGTPGNPCPPGDIPGPACPRA